VNIDPGKNYNSFSGNINKETARMAACHRQYNQSGIGDGLLEEDGEYHLL
jgi:hypothetical protein